MGGVSVLIGDLFAPQYAISVFLPFILRHALGLLFISSMLYWYLPDLEVRKKRFYLLRHFIFQAGAGSYSQAFEKGFVLGEGFF